MRRPLMLFFMLALFSSGRGAAQTPEPPETARNLFRTAAEKNPGVRLQIELSRRGKQQFVPLDTVFYSGDKVRFHFECNFPAYVEIYNRGSDGTVDKLFPYKGVSARVTSAKTYLAPPDGDGWFQFDQTPGTEQLFFIFSSAPLRRPTPHPAPRPAASPRPTPKPRPAPPGETVAVNPGTPPESFAGKELIAEESAFDEGKNLKRVQTKEESYLFTSPERLSNKAAIVIKLEHR